MEYSETQLNPRRQTLLEFIVSDYIRTAVPVASQQVAARHGLNVSSATIRNDMAEMEEMGFISRPHSSAGGVPSDSGYRFYVERLARRSRHSRRFEESVRAVIRPDAGDPDRWAQGAATVLAGTLQNVAIATSPRPAQTRVKQVQLVHLHGGQALLVIVLERARVRQHMVDLPGQIDQLVLTGVASTVNLIIAGKTSDEIAMDSRGFSDLDETTRAVLFEVVRLLGEEDAGAPMPVFTVGLRHMLSQPEFASGTRAREVVDVVEDQTPLRALLASSVTAGDVHVIIGGENHSERLRPYSFVLAPYGGRGRTTGFIGVFGPTRMDYVRAVASVRYLASFLGRIVGSLDDILA